MPEPALALGQHLALRCTGERPVQRWRWPALWALAAGLVLQCFLGLFASFVAILLLVPAERCPLALPQRPFWAFLAGITAALTAYEEGAIFGVFHAPGSVGIWDPYMSRRLPRLTLW